MTGRDRRRYTGPSWESMKPWSILLKAGVNPTHADERGSTLIMLQVRHRRPHSILNMLIESAQKSGNDIFGENRDGESALHVAARHGNIDAIQLFLGLGADASKKDRFGYYPLLRAVKFNPLWLAQPVFQAKVEAFGEVSTPNSLGQTPLHFAVDSSRDWPVKLLLETGADITVRDIDGRTPVDIAVSAKSCCCILSLLIQHGANPYYVPERCRESAIQIISRGAYRRWVADRFPLPPSLIKPRFSCVSCPILGIISRAPIVEIEHAEFISNHLQSCHKGPLGRPQCGGQQSDFALALHALCLIPTKPRTSGTTIEMVRSIIYSDASLLAKDIRGFTPLHYAAQSGKKEVIQLFLVRGLNTYCTKDSGVDIRSRFNDVVEGLIIAGRAEDALIRDEDGLCGIDRWAMSSIHDHLNFVLVNRLLARARILACLGDCEETYWLR
ncbi:hypothetical protein ACJ73_06341 [Blastomyces percursus]|uniref:Uncharacterized protein n=1 Tax=Blastomyces percursus TaxID=1658174 RepID=A0A1J9QQ40_9EURO|nr:hypothetical protein ACJ73_06341 [Blastomyces percursus]